MLGGLDLDGFYQSDVHILDTGMWSYIFSVGMYDGTDILNKILLSS